MQADPAYTQGLGFLAQAWYWRRRYDSAAAWADSAVAVDPNYFLGHQMIALTALEQGRLARAASAWGAAGRLGTDIETVNVVAGLARAAARRGATHEARRLVAEAESLAVPYAPQPAHTLIYLAQARAALGDASEALAWLERRAPREDLHFQLHLRCDPAFDFLAANGRFQALLARPRPSGAC